MMLGTRKDNEVKRISRYVLQKTYRMIGEIAKSIIIGEKLKMNKTRELTEESTEQEKQYFAKFQAKNEKLKAVANKKKSKKELLRRQCFVTFPLPKTQEAIPAPPENKGRNATKIIEAKKIQEENGEIKQQQDFGSARFERWKKKEGYDIETMNKIHSKFHDISHLTHLKEENLKKEREALKESQDKFWETVAKTQENNYDEAEREIKEEISFNDKFCNGGDEIKKMLPPKKFGYIASKKSFSDLPTHIAPKHDPKIEKIKHLIRRIVVKCTKLKNINLDNFSFGNLDSFLSDNPKELESPKFSSL